MSLSGIGDLPTVAAGFQKRIGQDDGGVNPNIVWFWPPQEAWEFNCDKCPPLHLEVWLDLYS